MASEEFLSWPDEIQELINDIGTVEGLDVMCAIAQDPGVAWRIERLADELAIDRFALEDAVRRLMVNGLIERQTDGTLLLAEGPPARRASLGVLTRLCREDRANVLGAIAHYSIGRIRTSAVRAFVRRASNDRDDR